MSVVVEGMKMPTIEMEWTIRHGADGKWYAIDTNAETTDGEWHEIIPVPPHERLIGANNLLNTAFKLVDEETFRAFRQLVIDAPTVIPASEKEE